MFLYGLISSHSLVQVALTACTHVFCFVAVQMNTDVGTCEVSGDSCNSQTSQVSSNMSSNVEVNLGATPDTQCCNVQEGGDVAPHNVRFQFP